MTQPAVPTLPQHQYDSPRSEGRKGKTDKASDATTGASAAGMRALTARLAAFYFRVPVKAFFRTRVDYLAYPRAINPLFQAQQAAAATQKWSWRLTTPGILAHAVQTQGWSFIPNQVLPPLLANISIGAVLYTSYLHFLALFHDPSATATQKRIYPPPTIPVTFAAGLSAGAVQSVLAAPLDALTVRFRTSDLLSHRHRTMWHYAAAKLAAIGARGAYAGAALSCGKDALAAALFFSTFEAVKAQGLYAFVRRRYGRGDVPAREDGDRPDVAPHYMLEPAFLLLAGAAASVAQQGVLHPLGRVQEVHWRRLEGLDRVMAARPRRAETLRLYGRAYRKTVRQCAVLARRAGGWRRWLFAEFWMSTLRQAPSTSAGLIVFEVVRRKYGFGDEATRIEMDGYDILLP